jgi:L-serine dehydratase
MAHLIPGITGAKGGAITTSIFELSKIGPGPSSSHTLGPMKAGLDFRQALDGLSRGIIENASGVEFRLYGSLAATGRGHGTDRALLAGFLGQTPTTCPPDFLQGLLQREDETYEVELEGRRLSVGAKNIVFDAISHEKPWSNAILARLLDKEDAVLFEREYYSVGGGFIEYSGQERRDAGDPEFEYSDMRSLKEHLTRNDIRLHELVLANETAVTGATGKTILKRLDRVLEVMRDSVKRGMADDSPLPGPLELRRKAPAYLKRAGKVRHEANKFLLVMNAAAHAAAEENAAGHVVVTAPTSGSAGVIPAVMHILETRFGTSDGDLRKGLLAAAAVGFLVKHNAGIAGAEMGCQGEIGTASSMAAAALCYARGYRFQVTENAAEIALEHHLGLTCDPVAGLVQIPCIERNAMGAVKAYNAFLLASLGDPTLHKVGLDAAIRAMALTGRDMCAKYKETSQGGLALSVPQC